MPASASPGPFVLTGCEPEPAPPCSGSEGPGSNLVRVTKTLIRLDHKGGGTTVVFRLASPTALRITVVRVYPSCKRIGTFTIRGRTGLNRVRFRGRIGGRALRPGGYRLIVRARGAPRDAAAVPIVVARGHVSPSQVRKVRRASVCSKPVAHLAAPLVAGTDDDPSAGGVLGEIKTRVVDPVGKAVGAVARKARATTAGLGSTANEPGSIVLMIVGAILLASAILGAIVLTRVVRLIQRY